MKTGPREEPTQSQSPRQKARLAMIEGLEQGVGIPGTIETLETLVGDLLKYIESRQGLFNAACDTASSSNDAKSREKVTRLRDEIGRLKIIRLGLGTILSGLRNTQSEYTPIKCQPETAAEIIEVLRSRVEQEEEEARQGIQLGLE